MDWIWVLNFLIGCCFAYYIVRKTDWFHGPSALIGAVLAGAMLFLWLPIIVVVAAVVAWAFHEKARRAARREKKSLDRRINWLKAIKDKHGVDDAAVAARVINQIKERS